MSNAYIEAGITKGIGSPQLQARGSRELQGIGFSNDKCDRQVDERVWNQRRFLDVNYVGSFE